MRLCWEANKKVPLGHVWLQHSEGKLLSKLSEDQKDEFGLVVGCTKKSILPSSSGLSNQSFNSCITDGAASSEPDSDPAGARPLTAGLMEIMSMDQFTWPSKERRPRPASQPRNHPTHTSSFRGSSIHFPRRSKIPSGAALTTAYGRCTCRVHCSNVFRGDSQS